MTSREMAKSPPSFNELVCSIEKEVVNDLAYSSSTDYEGFLIFRGTPKSSKLDNFSIETHGFGDPLL